MKDQELDLLRRGHQERAHAQKHDYETQKRAYNGDLFKSMTALMTAGVSSLSMNLRSHSHLRLFHSPLTRGSIAAPAGYISATNVNAASDGH